jgi:uncharacterized protein YdeI (YjbR/CyaY-like superfamily)
MEAFEMGAIAGDKFLEVEVQSAGELRAWFVEHHAQTEGIWLITFKKHVVTKHVTHEDVLDVLVAFGWCDGRMMRIDDDRVMQQISPRRTQPWARTYKERAERLIGAGLMQPSGLSAVESAKQNGMWDAMNDVDSLIVPDDLAAELLRLNAMPTYESFSPSTRRNILRWIAYAKRPETRARRIDRVAQDASRGVATPTNG